MAISNHRVESLIDSPDDQAEVTFKCEQSGSNRWRRMAVSGFEFPRRFLQRALPRGFRKVRYDGFLTHRRQDAFDFIFYSVESVSGTWVGQEHLLTSRTRD